MKNRWIGQLLVAVLVGALPYAVEAAQPPKAGDKAPDFTLKTAEDLAVRLRDLTGSNNVILIVLRGWPGYQCPVCTVQVRDYVAAAASFAQAKARVVMVYPGPAEALKAHAKEFFSQKQWPKDFVYVIDPDFSMVNAYGLRWDAPGETAYPSTFVLDQKGIVRFAKVSHSHSDRSKAKDVLEELKRMPTDQP